MHTGVRILVACLAAVAAVGVGATIVSGTPADGDHAVSTAAKWVDDVAADRWSDGPRDGPHDGHRADGYERGDGHHHDDVRRGGGDHHGPHGRW